MDSGADLRLDVDPPELVVRDRLERCPYFPERTARLPMRLPLRSLSSQQTDRRLAEGDRRWGRFLYRPSCPACRACEPIRLEVSRFRLRRAQRRALQRGDRQLETEIGEPRVDRERLTLYESHKRERGLAAREQPLTEQDYVACFIDRRVEAVEFRYRHEGRLAGVALADRGADSLSAVYCYFDPALARFGIGTYSILKQIESCREWGLRYLYLGLYIAGHPHMEYKARFVPHERRIEGEWHRFDAAPQTTAG